MRHDREGVPEPPYDGPFCVIRPNGLTYTVAIEPAPLTGEGSPQTYGSKHEAFGAARDLWTAHRLPLLDLSDGKVAAHREE